MSKHALFSELAGAVPATPSAGLTKSTIGAGLPSFTGRKPGDFHYNQTVKREYVLTGVAGDAASDDFSYADATALNGHATQTGGLTFLSPTALATVQSGRAVAAVGDSNFPMTGVDIGNTGPSSVSVTSAAPTGANGNVQLELRSNGDVNTGVSLLFINNQVYLYYGGANATAGGRTGYSGPGPGALTGGTNVYQNISYGAGGEKKFTMTLDPDGTITGYIDDVAVISWVYTSALPTTYGKAGVGFDVNNRSFDNFEANNDGTLAWTLTNSNAEYVNRLDTATGTVTVPDVDTAALHHYILTGNTTFAFPTPTGGDSFTMGVQQDATGGRTVTWPSEVDWVGGVTPTQTATANKTDTYTFLNFYGTRWQGLVAGQNI